MNQVETQLFAVSAVDGRYRSKVAELGPIASEAGLIANRIRVEAAWLLHLDQNDVIHADLSLNESMRNVLERLYLEPDLEALAAVKEHESITNHDVKAVEYYLRDVLRANGATDKQERCSERRVCCLPCKDGQAKSPLWWRVLLLLQSILQKICSEQ